jgi:hypothetical protein
MLTSPNEHLAVSGDIRRRSSPPDRCPAGSGHWFVSIDSLQRALPSEGVPLAYPDDQDGRWPDRANQCHATVQAAHEVKPNGRRSAVNHYNDQVAMSREISASAQLDAPCARQDLALRNLRWVLLHLIKETARHAGLADIIRETLDGARGM